MNRHTILWADDDPDDLEMFKEVVHELSSDYEVLQFGNGMEILDHLSRLHKKDYPCLIILDMNMPLLSGRETLSRLKGNPDYQSITVVVFTTSNSLLDKTFCKRFNTEIVTKPTTYSRLMDVVEDIFSYCHG